MTWERKRTNTSESPPGGKVIGKRIRLRVHRLLQKKTTHTRSTSTVQDAVRYLPAISWARTKRLYGSVADISARERRSAAVSGFRIKLLEGQVQRSHRTFISERETDMERQVTVIPAVGSRRTRGRNKADHNKKTRVAAYCRVSTEQEEQLNSFENQVHYYTKYI